MGTAHRRSTLTLPHSDHIVRQTAPQPGTAINHAVANSASLDGQASWQPGTAQDRELGGWLCAAVDADRAAIVEWGRAAVSRPE
jgi:hypothetical protein